MRHMAGEILENVMSQVSEGTVPNGRSAHIDVYTFEVLFPFFVCLIGDRHSKKGLLSYFILVFIRYFSKRASSIRDLSITVQL